jgi:hypothetical protein
MCVCRRDKNELVVATYSVKYRLELALVPMQHLTTLRQLMQTIFELLEPTAPEQPAARASRDFLNEVSISSFSCYAYPRLGFYIIGNHL